MEEAGMRRPRAIVTGVVAITLVCAFVVAATALAFTDVPDSHPHAGAINELAGLGVVSGKGDG
ncbi:MAG: S-layer homology domain-containing protein, partial [Thermoleophilia bacterium]|nr:S-layer homology domain-containing protein [Thermoleophilia bacterium]